MLAGIANFQRISKTLILLFFTLIMFNAIHVDVKNGTKQKLLDVVESLIGSDIILHHTKLFLKPPKVASFPLHQDWSYFPTQCNSMIAAVVHLSE